jgi:hypothetical protein
LIDSFSMSILLACRFSPQRLFDVALSGAKVSPYSLNTNPSRPERTVTFQALGVET